MAEEQQFGPQSHIGIEREPDLEPERRRRRAYGNPMPQRRRNSHGGTIRREIDSALTSVGSVRQTLGVSPDRLIVVEFNSWDAGCREVFEARFGAAVVDERIFVTDGGEEMTHVLVQFPSRHDVDRLQAEADRYRQDSDQATDLPPGLRRKFFDGLEKIRTISRDERIGARLRAEGFPATEPIYLDVDLWHPGTAAGAREVLDSLRQVCTNHQGRVTEDLRTSSLVLARVEANRQLAEALLDLDIVAQVNLPPVLPAVYGSIFDDVGPLPDNKQPAGDEPIVVVLDSGILPGQPLLRGWVVDERDFDTGEGTAVDQHGHGTQVAGLAVYGDVARCMDTGTWAPEMLVANAKVLRRHPQNPSWTMFPDEHRPEALIESAIRHFHETRGCRVFNLSLGNIHDVYSGGRQYAWAEVLDKLARELNVVIVVAAGNNPSPPMPTAGTTREEFQAGIRDALLDDPTARLCNPATSAVAVTVGSIARSSSPRTRDAFAGAPEGAPAPFSRVGPGYESKPTQRSVKPEFVAFGGNFAVHAFAGGNPRWIDRDIHLGEPTTRLNNDGGRPLTAVSGTSFAAPHVSNAAAWAIHAVEGAIGVVDANMARAILGVSAAEPPCGNDWLLDPDSKETWDRLRLVGYGMVDVERVRASLANDVCLIATDSVDEDHWHLYAVPVPPAFASGSGKRGISVALAFDPPVRAGRREYLSRTMWIEVLKGLTVDEIRTFRTRHTGDGDAPSLPQSKVLDMRPTKTDVQWSTLQVRRKVWSRYRNVPVADGTIGPVLHVLVGCQNRFPHGEETGQRYGLAVRLWHSDAGIEIYQQLKARVRARARQVVRAHVNRQG